MGKGNNEVSKFFHGKVYIWFLFIYYFVFFFNNHFFFFSFSFKILDKALLINIDFSPNNPNFYHLLIIIPIFFFENIQAQKLSYRNNMNSLISCILYTIYQKYINGFVMAKKRKESGLLWKSSHYSDSTYCFWVFCLSIFSLQITNTWLLENIFLPKKIED